MRYPAFSVPTLAFPALFFLLFVAPGSDADPTLLLASFAGFAVLAVAFFQFGVGIATERESPWERYRPDAAAPGAHPVRGPCDRRVPLRRRLGRAGRGRRDRDHGRLALGPPLAGARLSRSLLGGIPFALLGIALGYWASPRGALPLANILYLVLAFAGGLWTTPARLPGSVASFSTLVPTRPFGNVLWGAAEGRLWQPRDWLLLLAWGAVFGMLAAWGYTRDEGRRYG